MQKIGSGFLGLLCFMIVRIHIIFLVPSQLWKLDNGILKNNENRWTSTDRWNIRTEGKFVLIENTSKTKVWGTKKRGSVKEEEFLESKIDQLWIQGKPNTEGYFTLKSSVCQRFIKAVSSRRIQVKGKFSKVHNKYSPT